MAFLFFKSDSTFVHSGLNKRTTSEKLQESFSKFGEVVDGKIIFLTGVALLFFFVFELFIGVYDNHFVNVCILYVSSQTIYN